MTSLAAYRLSPEGAVGTFTKAQSCELDAARSLCSRFPWRLRLRPQSAAEGYVKITAPADGTRVERMNPTTLVYEVSPGPRGDHVHVYVDGDEVAILRKLMGSHALERLAAGQHTVCIKVVNRAHVPIGVEQCIKVTVE